MKIKSKSYNTAKAFGDYLDSMSKHGQTVDAVLAEHAHLEADLGPLLKTALWLEQHKTTLDPRPGFVSASWKRVLKKIRTAGEDNSRAVRGIRGGMQIRFAFRSALAVCLAFVLLLNTSMIASAARSSSPGNIFYGVKKAEESVQLVFTHSAEQNAALHIFMLKRRAAEIEELLLEGRYEHLRTAAAGFEYHLMKAWTAIDYWRLEDYQGANAKAEELRRTLTTQILVWQTLAVMAPESEREQLLLAINAARD